VRNDPGTLRASDVIDAVPGLLARLAAR
jgi:hypothetical protein